MESQNDEPPQRLRSQSRSRRRRSSSSRHDGHKVYPVTLNDSAPSHSLRVRPHLEQFIISSFRPFVIVRSTQVGRVGTAGLEPALNGTSSRRLYRIGLRSVRHRV